MIDLIDYRRPGSLDELWATLEEAEPPVVVSAGCTDLVPKRRAGLVPRATWVDLRRIAELQVFDAADDQLLLGACTTHHRVATNAEIRRDLPALAAACRVIGSRQIRSLGTLGGNAANCSPCADSFLALTVLDAEVVIRSRKASRRVAVTDFPQGPGVPGLRGGEVIEAFVVPRRPGRRSVFFKLGPRKAVAVAKVSVAASARVEDGVLRDVRLALGSVAPTVMRVVEAEALLEGSVAGDGDALHDVSKLVEAAVSPIDDVRSTAAYRRVVSGVLARRAVAALTAS